MRKFFKSLVLLGVIFDDKVFRFLKKGEKMAINRNLFIVGTLVLIFGSVVWLSTGSEGAEKRYEIQPYVGVPEYRTDAARAIDAYERLMDRYMNMTERELSYVGSTLTQVSRQLGALDAKVNRLHARLGRIEKKLGITTEQVRDQSKRTGQRRRTNRGESRQTPDGD